MVTSLSRPGLPRHEEMEGVQVWRTAMPSRTPLGWAAHAFGSAPRLVRVARDAQVIHAQAFPSVVPGVLARARSGAPLVATYHTSHFLKRAEMPAWRPLLSRLVRWPDYRLAASVEIARVAESLAPGTRCEPVTNGVETSIFRRVDPVLQASSRRRIVVPRRLFHKNGVEYFVRAMPKIVEGVDAEAVLVGDGPERPRLEALAAELEVAHRIRFLGARPNTEMPGLLSSADLAVFPSLMEATSVAALECMACELPVAASRVGGLPEIVDDEVGGLFEPADPDDLARRVVALLGRDDLPELGARAGSRVVAHWSNERLADRHLEVYRQVIEERGRTAA